MTKTIRLTKQFDFEMAHALHNYDGKCKHVHGHSYKLFVTIIGTPIQDDTNPKNGMLIDFGDLKRIVNQEIVDQMDHALVLYCNGDINQLPTGNPMFANSVVVDYQPTCENLVFDFAQRIAPLLPANISLHSLKLYETASSYAEWFAADNV